MEQLLICMSLSLIAGLLASRAVESGPSAGCHLYLVAGASLGPFFWARA